MEKLRQVVEPERRGGKAPGSRLKKEKVAVPKLTSIVVAVVSGMVLSSCNKPPGAPTQTGADDYHSKIQSKAVRHSLLFKSVHSSTGDQTILIIDGKQFENVRGFPPYYLDIPEQKRIVFAAGRWGPNEPAVIHVVDFRLNRHWGFKTVWGEGSGFGDGIHRKLKEESNYVESATEDEIVLVDATLLTGTMRKIVLDLKSDRIEQVEWFIYDDKGNLTNRYVVK